LPMNDRQSRKVSDRLRRPDTQQVYVFVKTRKHVFAFLPGLGLAILETCRRLRNKPMIHRKNSHGQRGK
jgi:hypothetical protein